MPHVTTFKYYLQYNLFINHLLPYAGKNRKYHLLCDSLEEDRQIREYLQHQQLNSILETQQKERNDATFSKACLFCSQHFEGNRASLIDHMAFDHNFSIGKPDDLGKL